MQDICNKVPNIDCLFLKQLRKEGRKEGLIVNTKVETITLFLQEYCAHLLTGIVPAAHVLTD